MSIIEVQNKMIGVDSMTNNEILIQALEVLSNECLKHNCCDDCPLSDGGCCSLDEFDGGCVNGIVRGKINELRRYNDEE